MSDNPSRTNSNFNSFKAGDNYPLVPITLAPNTTKLERGTVLGLLTSGANAGKYAIADITASTGEENAVCILEREVAISTTDTSTYAVTHGRVLGAELHYNGSETMNSRKAGQKSHRENLQDNGITILPSDGDDDVMSAVKTT